MSAEVRQAPGWWASLVQAVCDECRWTGPTRSLNERNGAILARLDARDHECGTEPVSPEDAALLDAVAGALGYQAVTLDDAVGAWTGHGPGCGCPDCEGMRQDAAGGAR